MLKKTKQQRNSLGTPSQFVPATRVSRMSRKVVVFLVLFSFLVRGGVGDDEDASPSAPRHDVDECGHVRKRSSAHARRKRINLPSAKNCISSLYCCFCATRVVFSSCRLASCWHSAMNSSNVTVKAETELSMKVCLVIEPSSR